MLSKVQAKSIADAQLSGAIIDGSLLDEGPTGRQIMDDANHAILWAAKKGYYTTPLSVGLFTDAVVDKAITDLTALGYLVDDFRRPGYKELMLSWS